MVQSPAKTLTLEEFLLLPDTKPASEYIDGEIVQKPMPQGKHSVIQGGLLVATEAVLKRNKIARAFPELRCVFGGRAIVPNVAVFRWQQIPREEDGSVANRFAIAPDWTIEILSPDQSQTKVTKKIFHCLKHGTQMAWLIDPEEKVVFSYTLGRSNSFEDPEEVLPVPEFAQEFRLAVGELFGWLVE